MIITLREELTNIVSDAFSKLGYDKNLGIVTVSNRPDLCQFQCNGAMAGAKIYKKNPFEIATNVVEILKESSEFSKIEVVRPGFINITLDNKYLADYIEKISKDERLGCPKEEKSLNIVIDYGGPNVAKPLHVGHLRSAIIGESLKRVSSFLGHNVKGDVHLGDWGLQMGMVISEIKITYPDLVYFDDSYEGEYPKDIPITISDLETMYPRASSKAKSDEKRMEEAREATKELQAGKKGYMALWKQIVNISVEDLKKNYKKLDVDFDLWLGESDSQCLIEDMVNKLKRDGYAYESQGALVVDVSEPDRELPPFIVYKSDGSALYSTTDLATIVQRINDYNPDLILYVVDNRQGNHFRQVFNCAYKTKIAKENLKLEHIGFGTMNGTDGKPYKTRDGGVMRLSDLIKITEDKAKEKMKEANISTKFDEEEETKVAQMVGLAALKYADLSNYRAKDYIFNIERFSSFEGATGPYLLYTTVRIKSILRKASELGFKPAKIMKPSSVYEIDLMLKLIQMPDALRKVFEDRAPNKVCEYVYELATAFNRFYHEHRIISETDEVLRDSWLGLCDLTEKSMVHILTLLGIKVPDRM
jgi:arginyl-tRNA synthetase